jgi:hypothetical protein
VDLLASKRCGRRVGPEAFRHHPQFKEIGMAFFRNDDLGSFEPVSAAELATVRGAGRSHSFRPSLEALESRDLASASSFRSLSLINRPSVPLSAAQASALAQGVSSPVSFAQSFAAHANQRFAACTQSLVGSSFNGTAHILQINPAGMDQNGFVQYSVLILVKTPGLWAVETAMLDNFSIDQQGQVTAHLSWTSQRYRAYFEITFAGTRPTTQADDPVPETTVPYITYQGHFSTPDGNIPVSGIFVFDH